MAQKRTSTQASVQSMLNPQDSPKRNKTSPSPVDDVSPPASVPNADHSALQGRSQPVAKTVDSNLERNASATDPNTSDDESSDQSSTASESEDDSEGEDEGEWTVPDLPEDVITLRPFHHPANQQARPNMDPEHLMRYAEHLRQQLHSFLPRLQKANKDLVNQGTKANMEEVGEGEPHIEMSLGLGVLEERKDSQAQDIKLPTAAADDDQSDSDDELDPLKALNTQKHVGIEEVDNAMPHRPVPSKTAMGVDLPKK